MTTQELQNKYRNYTSAQLRSAILAGNADSDNAGYYLIRYRMYEKLSLAHSAMQVVMPLQDCLQEFYLYLRNGATGDKPSWSTVSGLRSWVAFESFIQNTFRNFCLKIRDTEIRQDIAKQEIYKDKGICHSNRQETELQIHLFAILIATLNQHLSPRDMYIYLRAVVGMIDRNAVYSDKFMADAMGITYDNYRKIDSRNRARVRELLTAYRNQEPQNLNDGQRALINIIEDQFEHLLPIIGTLCIETMKKLPCHEQIEVRKKEQDEKDKAAAKDDGVRYSISGPRIGFGLEDNPFDGGIRLSRKAEQSSLDDFSLTPEELKEMRSIRFRRVPKPSAEPTQTERYSMREPPKEPMRVQNLSPLSFASIPYNAEDICAVIRICEQNASPQIPDFIDIDYNLRTNLNDGNFPRLHLDFIDQEPRVQLWRRIEELNG